MSWMNNGINTAVPTCDLSYSSIFPLFWNMNSLNSVSLVAPIGDTTFIHSTQSFFNVSLAFLLCCQELSYNLFVITFFKSITIVRQKWNYIQSSQKQLLCGNFHFTMFLLPASVATWIVGIISQSEHTWTSSSFEWQAALRSVELAYLLVILRWCLNIDSIWKAMPFKGCASIILLVQM